MRYTLRSTISFALLNSRGRKKVATKEKIRTWCNKCSSSRYELVVLLFITSIYCFTAQNKLLILRRRWIVLRFHMHTTLVIDCNQKSSAGIINAIVYAVAYYIRLAVVQSECGMLRLTIQHMATNKHNGSLFLLGLHRYQSIVNMLGRCLLSMSFSFPSLVVLCIIANLRGKDVQNQRTTSFEQNYPSVIWLIALELLLSVTPIFQSIFLLMPFVKRYLWTKNARSQWAQISTFNSRFWGPQRTNICFFSYYFHGKPWGD